MDNQLVYEVAEVARLLGISEALAYQAVHRGEIPSIRVGRRLLVPRRPFLALLESAAAAPDGADAA